MLELKLESLVVSVPGSGKGSPLEQAQETLKIATEVAEEIKRALVKCQGISQFDGRPAAVVGLSMTGKTSVENIYVIYRTDEKTTTSRWYSRKDFYDL